MSASPEFALLEHAERLSQYRFGRRVIHIPLSQMKLRERRDYHMRIAINTFENMVSLCEGRIFRLSNHDLVFVFRSDDPVPVEDAIRRLHRLFRADPLSGNAENELLERFYTSYNLDTEYDGFRMLVRRLYDEAQRALRERARDGVSVADKPPLDAVSLKALLDVMTRSEVSSFLRRQTIYACIPKRAPEAIFDELFISIGDLHSAILPGSNITANRWLFQYVTESLDQQMLKMLMRADDASLTRSFSINLNISTILSPEFLVFDASLSARARGTIVLEIQPIDIFADLSAFAFARDFAHDRGYRVCLDGLNEYSFTLLDRERLNVDLVKLAWLPGMVVTANAERREKIGALIERAGKPNVILCHVDSEEAIEFGRSLGIALYQGRHIDKMAAAARPSLVANR